jgi:hypothetical protein
VGRRTRKLRERLEQADAWVPLDQDARPDVYATNAARLEAALGRPLGRPARAFVRRPAPGVVVDLAALLRADGGGDDF